MMSIRLGQFPWFGIGFRALCWIWIGVAGLMLLLPSCKSAQSAHHLSPKSEYLYRRIDH